METNTNPVDTNYAQGIVDEQVRQANKLNTAALNNYSEAVESWKRNAPIFQALKMPVPPEPTPPMLQKVDADGMLSGFLAASADVAQKDKDGIPAEGVIEAALATFITPVQAPALAGLPAPVVANAQTALGAQFDATTWYAAKGDNSPEGSTIQFGPITLIKVAYIGRGDMWVVAPPAQG